MNLVFLHWIFLNSCKIKLPEKKEVQFLHSNFFFFFFKCPARRPIVNYKANEDNITLEVSRGNHLGFQNEEQKKLPNDLEYWFS